MRSDSKIYQVKIDKRILSQFFSIQIMFWDGLIFGLFVLVFFFLQFSTFTADESVYCMRTQKTLQLFFKPEPDFWMIMVRDKVVRFRSVFMNKNLNATLIWLHLFFQMVNAPSERKTTKDGTEYTEYRCEDAHEIVYREILKQSYYMFRLFNGSFQESLVGDDVKQQVNCLTTKLTKFYSKVNIICNNWSKLNEL